MVCAAGEASKIFGQALKVRESPCVCRTLGVTEHGPAALPSALPRGPGYVRHDWHCTAQRTTQELGVPRKDVVVSTKVMMGRNFPGKETPTGRGLSRKTIVEGLRARPAPHSAAQGPCVARELATGRHQALPAA